MPWAIAIVAVGAAVAAAGSIMQSQQAAKVEEYQAEVAENQAQMAKDMAAIEARRARIKGEIVKGQARAKFAKSGTTFEGSPLLVMEELAAQLEHDVQIIKYGGRVRAIGYQAEAGLYNMRARMTREAGYWAAGSSLLTGASKIAGMTGAGSGAGSGTGTPVIQ